MAARLKSRHLRGGAASPRQAGGEPHLLNVWAMGAANTLLQCIRSKKGPDTGLWPPSALAHMWTCRDHALHRHKEKTKKKKQEEKNIKTKNQHLTGLIFYGLFSRIQHVLSHKTNLKELMQRGWSGSERKGACCPAWLTWVQSAGHTW